MIRGERTDIDMGQHAVFYRGDYLAMHDIGNPYECRWCRARGVLSMFEKHPTCHESRAHIDEKYNAHVGLAVTW